MARSPAADAEEALSRFEGALAQGLLEAAIAQLFRDPAEKHPLLQRASAPQRESLLRGSGEAEARLRAQFGTLHGWWQDAKVVVTRSRVVHPELVEVYQDVVHPGSSLPARIVFTMRKMGDDWGYDGHEEAVDDTARAYLPGLPPVDRASWEQAYQDIFGESVRFLEDRIEWSELDFARVLGHPPSPAFQRYEGLASETMAALERHERVVELAWPLAEDLDARVKVLTRMSRAIYVFVQLGAPVVYLPVANKLLEPPEAIRLLQNPKADVDELSAFWVDVTSNTDLAYTRGLGHFMLPEVEVPLDDDPGGRLDLCLNVAIYQMQQEVALRPGDTLGTTPKPTWRADYGRRGPSPDESYGRWGAVQLKRP